MRRVYVDIIHFVKGCQNAVWNSFIENKNPKEAKFQYTIIGDYREGEIVTFDYNLKGRVNSVISINKEKIVIVDIFCEDFRTVYNKFLNELSKVPVPTILP